MQAVSVRQVPAHTVENRRVAVLVSKSSSQAPKRLRLTSCQQGAAAVSCAMQGNFDMTQHNSCGPDAPPPLPPASNSTNPGRFSWRRWVSGRRGHCTGQTDLTAGKFVAGKDPAMCSAAEVRQDSGSGGMVPGSQHSDFRRALRFCRGFRGRRCDAEGIPAVQVVVADGLDLHDIFRQRTMVRSSHVCEGRIQGWQFRSFEARGWASPEHPRR